MKRHSTIWRRIVAAAIMATGIAVVWAIVGGWMGSLATLFVQRPDVDEQLQFAVDGTPVVSVNSEVGYNTVSLSRRTLDGQPWPSDYEYWLGSAYLLPRAVPPRLIQVEPQWTTQWTDMRIGGGSDGKRPPTAWYVVRTVDPPGKVHWVGYDAMSKRQVGYIGTKGFRLTSPPTQECFDLPQGNLGRLSQFVSSPQYLSFHDLVRYHSLQSSERPAPWLVFQLDGQNLWEINLRERSARIALNMPSARSISLLSTRKELADSQFGVKARPEEDAAGRPKKVGQIRFAAATLKNSLAQVTGTLVPTTPSATFQATQFAPSESGDPPKMTRVVAVRADDRVVLCDVASEKRLEFVLPKEVPADWIQAYWFAPEELLITYRTDYWSGGSTYQLLWIAADGTVKRRERIELQGYVPSGERQIAWQLAPLTPVPVYWIGRVLVGQPLLKLQWNQADTYSAALKNIFHINWPPLVAVLTVSLLSALLAMRWHRRLSRSHRWWWTALVLLFGPAGTIAYWLEHRLAKLEACHECGQTVPRDRDACAVCATPFPAAPLVGTEIFA